MERNDYPHFGKEYAKARLQERVVDPNMLQRGKIFEMVLINVLGDCWYEPEYFVVTGIEKKDGSEPKVTGFSFHNNYCQYIGHQIDSPSLSTLGVVPGERELSSYLLETNLPDVPEEVLIAFEKGLPEAREYERKYEDKRSDLIGCLQQFLQTNRT